jgi:phosphatidylserine decarboxylase
MKTLLSLSAFKKPLMHPADAPAASCGGQKGPAHEPDTEELISILEHDSKLKALVIKSIAKAKECNPDPVTNPVQSLEDFYKFMDWATKCMPWQMIYEGEKVFSLPFDQVAQGLIYFYFLLDQPLEELEGNGNFYNSLQYVEPLRTWIIHYCQSWAKFLDTPESWSDKYYKAVLPDPNFGLDPKLGWYEDPKNWHNFNDFFARKLKDEHSRPIASPDDDSVVAAPADACPQGAWAIDENSYICGENEGVIIKASVFTSIPDLLGGKSKYCNAFAGGTMTHTYLNEADYHHFHFPMSGTVKEASIIMQDADVGGIVVWSKKANRYVLLDQKPGWQTIESRGLIVIETEKFGTVALLPIGMGQVSSVVFKPEIKPGAKVKKGDEIGNFYFGGSDFVIVFQKGVKFELTAEVLKHQLMGEKYGVVSR